jgi:predicted oxidoreductase
MATVPLIPLTSSAKTLALSKVVYGIWRWDDPSLDDAARNAIFKKCISLGITTFDGADIYGGHTCEQLFGKVLAANPDVKREDIQIVTKCGICLTSKRHPEFKFNHYNTTKEYILNSVKQTLEDLGTKYVDLLLIHRPDFLMNPDEVADAFDTLSKNGSVRFFGVSNFSASQFDLLSSRLNPNTALVTNQIELSPVACSVLSDGTLDQCLKLRIKPMLWSPLKHLHNKDIDQKIRQTTLEVIDEIAAAHNTTADRISLAWGLQHPSQPVTIIGTTKIDRIQVGVDALKISLTREEWFRIWCAGVGRRSVP